MGKQNVHVVATSIPSMVSNTLPLFLKKNFFAHYNLFFLNFGDHIGTVSLSKVMAGELGKSPYY
jgi:hypothetical protein